MLKISFMIIIVILTPVGVYSQEFLISDGFYPVVDKYAKQVYFHTYYRDSLLHLYRLQQRSDLNGQNIENINIPDPPTFSNNSRQAIFAFRGTEFDERFVNWSAGYYLVDFSVDDSGKLIIPVEDVQHYSFWRTLGEVLFSPDDSKFLIYPYNSFAYYSFKDSLIHDPGYYWSYSDVLPAWTSDTTIIFTPNGGSTRIIEYNYTTEKFDTLINKDYPPYSMGDFAYNTKLKSIIYSTINLSTDLGIELYLYDMISKTEKNIFDDFGGDFPYHGAHHLQYLEMSPEYDKAAIISNAAIEPHDSRILIYYYDNDSLFLYKDLGNNDYSGRYNEIWYDNNILIYENFSGIWGLDTSIPVNISYVNNTIINTYQLKQNYPNPFNPSTTIEFTIPYSSYVNLIIYNLNGQLVDILLSDDIQSGSYKLIWDASKISSGIYFYKLSSKNLSVTKRCLLLK
jgi:hypothetical protein